MLPFLLLAPAAAAIIYTLFAASRVSGWQPTTVIPDAPMPAVTVLKPLHGAEPRLAANLATFAAQDYPAPVQILCGVTTPTDGAVPIVDALRAQGLPIELVVDPTRHGSNGKVGSLINMAAHARGELLVLSDSDMGVAPDYLRRLALALSAPWVGAATCLYVGRGDSGRWSRLAAAWISWQFLPSVMAGLALGLAEPCMGSTIALHRETLARIGGFGRFADLLADDHAIGAAVREAGLRVVVPPMLTTHGCAETSLRAIVAHELRWLRTLRLLDPAGYAGSVVTHPLPLALLPLLGGVRLGAATIALALAARLLLAIRIDRLAGAHTARLVVLPLRDALSFALFVASFFVRRVDWRGETLRVEARGTIVGMPGR